MTMRNESIHPPPEDLFAYRDGELMPEKRTLIEAHVMGCSTCRSFIDQVSSLEAELRQSPDRAPADYLERLHESVRARIAAAGGPEAVAAVGERLDEVPAVGDARRIPPAWAGRERRGDFAAGTDEDQRGKAPRLPWAAVLSTASAAVAVLVVVVILLKQGVGQRVMPPGPLANRAPAETGDSRVTLGAAGEKDAAAKKAADESKEALGRRDKQKLEAKSAEDRLAKGDANAPAPAAEKPAAQGAIQQDEIIQNQQEALTPPAGTEENRSRAAAPTMSLTSSGYEELLSRFGLPPVWDGARVTPEALQRAEPELRSLYVSGGADGDSARIRLYLAEAARLRYMPGDSTLLQEIENHYRRAINLASPGSETARVAEERLQTLER